MVIAILSVWSVNVSFAQDSVDKLVTGAKNAIIFGFIVEESKFDGPGDSLDVTNLDFDPQCIYHNFNDLFIKYDNLITDFATVAVRTRGFRKAMQKFEDVTVPEGYVPFTQQMSYADIMDWVTGLNDDKVVKYIERLVKLVEQPIVEQWGKEFEKNIEQYVKKNNLENFPDNIEDPTKECDR